jgi:hypothetical protein
LIVTNMFVMLCAQANEASLPLKEPVRCR